MTAEDKLNELRNKLTALEIHLQNSVKDSEKLEDSLIAMHDKDVHRLEESLKDIYNTIKDIYEKTNVQNTDVNSVIFQFKNIIKEFTELAVDVKEVKKNVDTLNTSIAVCETARENADIFKYIRRNPAKSLAIFVIVGALLLMAVLLKNPSIVLKPMGLG